MGRLQVRVERRFRWKRWLGFFLLWLATLALTVWLAILIETRLEQRQAADLPEGAAEEGASPAQLAVWDSGFRQIADQISPTVVFIKNINIGPGLFGKEQEVVVGSGSGVIFSADGYLITNNHVVAGANKILVALADGRQGEAQLIGTDPLSDLALLKLELPGLSVAPLGDSDMLAVGDLALAIGNPGGEDFARSLTVGVVSGLNRLLKMDEGCQFRLIQTDAAINPGNSGGPLVNGAGEVIGINSVKIIDPNFEGMGFAIPINTVMEVIEALLLYGHVPRPALEVLIWGEVTPELAAFNQLGTEQGVIIIPVEGGVAATAGLKQYDIIIAINQVEVADSSRLQEEILRHQIGDPVQVTVMRGQERIDVIVKLGELRQ